MAPPSNGGGLEESVRSAELDSDELDELYEVLADSKRRSAIRSLTTAGGSLPFDELVDDVARETTVEPVDQERKRDVATALYHVHLPKLRTAGLVTEFDTDGAVEVADQVAACTDDLIELL